MSVITKVPEPNIWDDICKEFEKYKQPYQPEEDDRGSVMTDYQDYDPAKHNPVFYGKMHYPVSADMDAGEGADPAITHPSCIGYAFTEKPPASPVPSPPPVPAKDLCSPREYLDHYIFPVLLPILEDMLHQAKKEKCFERRRTKFDALDYLAQYLYTKNPKHPERGNVELEEIPFVKEWLKDHPRPPLPLSLIWTEEEACLIIQSHWRGYLVRKEPDVQELRQWQAEWREENRGIQSRVNDFWEKKMPDGDQPSPSTSQDELNKADLQTSETSPGETVASK